jgi:hypothetical protein
MSARRWPLPVLGGVLSTALGVAINIATDVGSNAWAWTAVAVLTGAGIAVGLASDKLARTRAGAPTHNAPVVEVSGNKNRVKVNLLGPGSIIAVGVVVIVAVTAGLLVGISTKAGPLPAASGSNAPAVADKLRLFTVTVLDDPTDDIDGFWRGSAGGYLFPSGTVPTLEAPSPADRCANWSHWALRKGGVRTFTTSMAFTVAASGSESVRVNTARLHVEPLPTKAVGDVIQCSQGGPVPYSRLSLDLDHQSATYLYPTTGPQAEQSRPFALEISAVHAEEVLVDAQTTKCYCSWYLELLIEVNGTPYTYRVDDAGKPFVTAPRDGDYTHFIYDKEELRWRPFG